MNTIRVASTAIVATVTVALTAGCGGADQGVSATERGHGTPSSVSQPPAETRKHNDADVSFAQGMIPHHRQAIDMSRLAYERAGSEQVEDLARRIEAAQGPEIDALTGWLESWEIPTSREDMPSTDHGNMRGMMTSDDMQRLRQAEGDEFDRMFLTMMIEHHEGAVDMARTELARGRFPEAKRMARQIIDTQQAEIDTMRDLLNRG